ncbi:MAG TPA: rhodanese-like domain-containing protein [Pyrinomonadaceae bacterium]|nr:rhodanese-like domain-containing protein [Pyrinomonadaceae bacterium]
MPICQYCGASVTEGATTCPACGSTLTASARPATPQADPSDADAGAGRSSLRIALALLAVALFGLGFWTLIRNSTEHSENVAMTLPARRPAAATTTTPNAPARNAPPASSADNHDDSALADVRRMTVAEAREAFEKGTAVMADVRPSDAYNTRHIKDALLLDEKTLHGSLDHLPKDKLIITYCA